jgi:predicted nucleic acid-binding protein
LLLVVDASILIEEGFRNRGRHLFEHPSLQLAVASEAWSETVHERRKRVVRIVERGKLGPAEAADLAAKTSVIDARVTVYKAGNYAERLAEATRRIPRDPRDAHSVALALQLDCGIWTSDQDFFGCGLPVWSTEVLQTHLEHLSQARRPS